MPSFTQRSLAGGEVAPALYSRADTTKYQTGAKSLQNMIVQRFGPATRRPGTQFVCTTDAQARLVPFVFNDEQTYILEFGNNTMRVIRDGQLLGAPYSLATGLDSTDTASMQFVQYGDTLFLASQTFAPKKLVRNGDTDWTLSDIEFVPTIDKPRNLLDTNGVPATGTLTSDGTAPSNNDTVTIDTKVYTFKTTLTPAEGEVLIGVSAAVALDNLKSAINHTAGHETTYYCVAEHPTVLATTNTNTTQVVRARAVGVAGNSIATTETSSHLSWGGATLAGGTAGGTGYTWAVSAYDEDKQESQLSDSVSESTNTATLTWDRVPNAVGYYVYKTQDNGQYGFIGIAADPGSGTTVTFVDTGYTPDYTDTNPVFQDPFADGYYPAVVGVYQQRLCFANTTTEPDKIWMSQIGFPYNFATRSPVQNDDAVIFSLAGRRVNEVRHIVDVGKLLVFTSTGEWIIKGDVSGAVTPTSINAVQQTYHGANRASPIVIGNNALFVQKQGSIVRDLRYDFNTDGFNGSDLTVFAPHLTDGYSLDSVAYSQTPNSLLWAARSDGVLLGFTYLKEHEIWAWHPHVSELSFYSVATIPENGEDVPYLTATKPDGGWIIVRMPNQIYFSAATTNAFLDAYYVYDGRNTSATTLTLASNGIDNETTLLTLTASTAIFTAGDVGNVFVIRSATDMVRCTVETYTSTTVVRVRPDRTVAEDILDTATTDWDKAVDQFSGMSVFNGYEVNVQADGYSLGTGTISGGGLNLEEPHTVVFIGLNYISDVDLLDLEIVQGETLYDKKLLVREVTVRVQDTSTFKAGPDADNLQEFKNPNHDYDTPTGDVNGSANVLISGNWGDSSGVLIRQDEPLPLTVQAVVRHALVSGV
jgi:hypothetical protein